MARFRIVPDESRVVIDATSSVHPIRTVATGLEGFVDVALSDDGSVDMSAPAAGQLTFPVRHLRSANPLEQRELHRRIHARRYPTIDGRLTALRAGSDAARYVVAGDLTFLGVTRPYENELTITHAPSGRLSLTGESIFDVRDFGMEPPRILLLRVHPEVTVRIDLVAAATGDAQPT